MQVVDYTKEQIIEQAREEADAWEKMGENCEEIAHVYTSDANMVRDFVTDYENLDDLKEFHKNMNELDTIVRDAMNRTLNMLDDAMLVMNGYWPVVKSSDLDAD